MPEKKSSRVVTFDLMRGYFLIAIILDHLYFFPNGLDWWSARGDLFVTTAEGFFLISGLVLGIVRGSKLIDKPFKDVTKLLFQRSLQLYLTTITLVILFTILGWTLFMNYPGLKYGIMQPINIPDLLWQSISLQYFYGWADYLRLYAVFIFVSPLAMWLLRRGLWYILIILNVVIWLTFPTDPNIPDHIQESLQLVSWQLIFFGGMTLGFYWNQLTTWWLKLSSSLRTSIQWIVITYALFALITNIAITFGHKYFPSLVSFFPQDLGYRLYIDFFDKERLPLPRLLLFALWFSAAFIMFTKFERPIVKFTGWLLLPFGTNSLYVYTVHAFLLFFVHLYFTEGSLVYNFIIAISIIAIIRIMIQYKILMKIIPR
jgi:hypothetical protein